jgi:hypothetical protein
VSTPRLPKVMDSAPTATPTSIAPVRIWLAMSWIALRPEAQKRLTDEAPAVCGMPAARAAARPRYAARPSPTC